MSKLNQQVCKGKKVNHQLRLVPETVTNTIVKNIITYSCEIWSTKETTKRMSEAVEMDFRRRVVGRLERTTNESMRGNYVNDAYDTGCNKEQTTRVIWTCAKNA